MLLRMAPEVYFGGFLLPRISPVEHLERCGTAPTPDLPVFLSPVPMFQCSSISLRVGGGEGSGEYAGGIGSALGTGTLEQNRPNPRKAFCFRCSRGLEHRSEHAGPKRKELGQSLFP